MNKTVIIINRSLVRKLYVVLVLYYCYYDIIKLFGFKSSKRKVKKEVKKSLFNIFCLVF
jgi:hypothetical protein